MSCLGNNKQQFDLCLEESDYRTVVCCFVAILQFDYV